MRAGRRAGADHGQYRCRPRPISSPLPGTRYIFQCTNIDTTGDPRHQCGFGDDNNNTAWTVTNQGTLSGASLGVFLFDAGSNLTNSGTISGATNRGVQLFNGGTLVNQAGGTISSGSSDAVTSNGGTITNAGTITGGSNGGGIFLTGNNNTVTNSGTITGGLSGVDIDTAGTVTNSGSIKGTGANSDGVTGNVSSLTNKTGGTISAVERGVNLSFNNASVTNEQGATISGGTTGVSFGGGGSLVNSGTISQTATNGGAAVFLSNGGTVTNQAGGNINGAADGIFATGAATPTTIINSGSISATGASGTAVTGSVTTLTNHTGGTITGAQAISINSGANITNETGATISGNTIGISMGSNASIINAGTIEATAANGRSVSFTGTGTNTLTLQTGSVLKGTAFGSTAIGGATNNLVLQGNGSANNNFVGFNSLDVQQGSNWILSGNAEVGTVTINGTLTVPWLGRSPATRQSKAEDCWRVSVKSTAMSVSWALAKSRRACPPLP